MSDQRNLVIAIALSVGIIFAFQFFYEMPRRQAQERQAAEQAQQSQTAPAGEHAAQAPGISPSGATAGTAMNRADALA